MPGGADGRVAGPGDIGADLGPLAFLVTPGQWGDAPQMIEVLKRIRYYFLASDPDPGNWEIVVGSECAEWYRTSGTFTGFVMRCFDGLDRAPFMDRAWPEADARYEPFGT
ncbi:hypothetical protein ABZY81_37620 [Streptomyces sp. NPDC006514]|uniref:hypothetical protein n=1 Tax=Streptomyces sp. NPDC006514 TaxID=3154308 RepID=UPI0033A240C3